MAHFAKRILLDVILAWVFAVLWGPIIRWVVLFLAIAFVWVIVQNAGHELKEHGTGRNVDLSQIVLNTDVSSHTLNWSITNNTGETISKVVITCDDGEYSDYVAPDQYVPAGETLSGTNTDSDFNYSSVCKITNAYSYSK